MHPYTHENRAAHGCITYTQTCDTCGAERAVNANQWHYEYGTWGPARAVREARRQAEEVAARRAKEAAEIKLAQRRVTEIKVSRRRGGWEDDVTVRMLIDGRPQCHSLSVIEDAARQPDNGDGLPFYSGLLRLIAIKEEGLDTSHA